MEVIYCHYDGYPAHNGAVLLEHYRDEEKTRKLIALGDLSSLRKEVEPTEGTEHSIDKPQKEVTIAYHRDWGEDRQALQPRRFSSRSEYTKAMKEDSCWIEHVYLFDTATNAWLWSPVRKGKGLCFKPLTEKVVEDDRVA